MATIDLPSSKQLHISALPLRLDESQPVELEYLREMRELSKCNTPALKAVLFCVESGRELPQWLRKFLADGIRRHLKDRNSSLDQSLGLQRKDGSRSDDKAYDAWQKRWTLINAVHQLKDQLNSETGKKLGITGACRKLIPGESGFGLTAESLRRDYRRFRDKLTTR